MKQINKNNQIYNLKMTKIYQFQRIKKKIKIKNDLLYKNE